MPFDTEARIDVSHLASDLTARSRRLLTRLTSPGLTHAVVFRGSFIAASGVIAQAIVVNNFGAAGEGVGPRLNAIAPGIWGSGSTSTPSMDLGTTSRRIGHDSHRRPDRIVLRLDLQADVDHRRLQSFRRRAR